MTRRIVGMLVLLGLFGWSEASAQVRQVSGRVVSEEAGNPLSAASVFVAGTSIGTVTDAQGNFSLQAPAGEVRLRVALIGYRTADVTVPAGESNVTVALAQDVLQLEGVVVTGQGTSVARRNLANAVATVTAEELGEAPPAETIEKMLQGRVAGASIEQNSGAPGGGVRVRLRGVSTVIGENEPLYVVDGVIISNIGIGNNMGAVTLNNSGPGNNFFEDAVVNRVADLNPNEIESIDILKGPSAAALYGSRAANGVILITTKRGRPGQARVSVSQKFGVFDASRRLPLREFTREEAVDELGPTLLGRPTESFFGADGQPLFDGNQNEMTGRNALSTETQVSVSGGDENTRYFLSGLVKNDEGIITNTGFEKQSLRVNVEQTIADRLTISGNANMIHSLAARGLTNNDNGGVSYWMVFPFTPEFMDLRQNADGTWPVNPFERSNPLQTAALTKNDEDVWRVLASGSVGLDAVQTDAHTIRVLGTAGVDYFNQENDLFFPPSLQFEPLDGQPGSSLLSKSDNTDLTLTGNAVWTYQAPRFSSTLTAGVQFEDRELSTARISAFNLTAGQQNVGAGTVTQVQENLQRVKDLGFFAQEELLLLDERLLLTGGIRADKSSVNGDPNEFFYFPKASASFRFGELGSAVNDFKLRAAWGRSGNQPQWGQKFTQLISNRNVEGIPGVVLGAQSADPALEPEKLTEIEAGFDATLFDERAVVEFTVFQKNVDDMLLQRTPAPSTGFTREIFNGGEMRVRGIEVALNATPIRTGSFSWISRTTFSHDESEITDLPVPAFRAGSFSAELGGEFQIEEGASATQIIVSRGLDSSGNLIVEQGGDAQPDFRMGFSNDFTFGSFNVYSLFDWAHGQSVINLTQLLTDASFFNAEDWTENPRDLTLPDGSVIPEAGEGQHRVWQWLAFDNSSGYLQDASYLKLREVSLSYSIPQSALGSLFGSTFSSARLTLSGRNLVTWTPYSGLDPEVSLFANQPIATNVDVAPFPPSRSFWATVDFSF